MKAGGPHLVPLPPHAVELIQEALRVSGLPSDRARGPVFASPRDCTRPINPEALTRAMDRLRDCIGVENLTVHDLRRTGSTALTSERLRVSPFIRTKVLGHESDPGGGAAVSSVHYDVNEYLSDKRSARRAWEGLLLRIVAAGPSSAGRTTRTGIIRDARSGLVAANDAGAARLAPAPSSHV